MEAPILAYPSSEADFTLNTEASAIGIGAVLSHGVERLIMYAIRGLSKSERNYSITKKGLMADMWIAQIYT